MVCRQVWSNGAPDEYVSLAESVGHGERAHYRENEALARLLGGTGTRTRGG